MGDFADVARVILRVSTVIIADALFDAEFVVTAFGS